MNSLTGPGLAGALVGASGTGAAATIQSTNMAAAPKSLSSGTNYTIPANGSEDGLTYVFIGTVPLSGSVTAPLGLRIGYMYTVVTFSTSPTSTAQAGGVSAKVTSGELLQNPSSPVANGTAAGIGSINSTVRIQKISATQWSTLFVTGIFNGTS